MGDCTAESPVICEKVAKLRSILSLLEESITLLDLNFRTLNDEYKKSTPPIIYPKMAFRTVKTNLIKCKSDLLRLEDIQFHKLLFKIDELAKKSMVLLEYVADLQELYEQRTAGLTLFDAVEKSHSLLSEYSNMSKIYNAADAVSYEFIKRCLGFGWIEENGYVPVTLFSSFDYCVSPDTLIIYIPYYDSFRLRFWPILAHEVAHPFVNRLMKDEEEFLELVNAYCVRLERIFHEKLGKTVPRKTTILQIVELVCDITGTLLVGPPAFFSSSIYLKIKPQLAGVTEGGHPPNDVRIFAVKNVLDRMNFTSIDKDVKHFIDTTITYLKLKDLCYLSLTNIDFMNAYRNLAIDLSNDMLDRLSTLGVQPFTKDDWINAVKKFKNKNLSELNPIQLLNLAWIKRVKTTIADSNLDYNDYGERRKIEPKLFEQIIEALYLHYSTKVVSEVEIS